MSNQLTVRVASIGKPETLRGLLDVSVPLGVKNGDVLFYTSNTQNFTLGSLPFFDGANTLIQIKRSSVANASSLNNGELYYSFFDQKLYIGNSTNHLVPIAGNYYVDLANSIFYISNTAYEQANVARTQANVAFAAANTSYNQANVARTHANVAFEQSNVARTQANVAFAVANTKFSANGGIIYGDVEITGNLSVLGNVTTFSTNNIVIDDPFILLANNNGTDILDIGVAAHYDSNLHTGIFRSATTKEWYLFKGYDEHFFYTDGGNINLFANNFTLDILNSDIRTNNLILGGANAISWIISVSEQANTARVHANTSYISANVAFIQANTSRNHANTAFDQANTSRTHANVVFEQANTSRNHANTAFDQANTARVHANVAFSRANTVYDVANTKLNLSGGTIAGDLVVTGNITISGQTTYANTVQLQVGDNIIVLNADLPPAFAPSENAGIGVNRGSSVNVALIWNEGTDKWTFTDDGTNYLNIASNTDVETITTISRSSFDQANVARVHANTAHSTSNVAFDQANTARTHANIAFAKANSALPNVSGATFDGNLIVSSNLLAQIIRVSDGSNADPSLSFANSANTGIYRTSNNEIVFTISGRNAIAISDVEDATNVVFEILNSNNESVFLVTANTDGNVFEVYDANNINLLHFSVGSDEIYLNNTIDIKNTLIVTTKTVTISTNTQTLLTSFAANSYIGGKFSIMAKNGANTHLSDLNVVHDGSLAYLTEYGIINSNVSLYSVVTDVNVGNVRLLVTPTQNTTTTFRVIESKFV